MRAFPGKCNVLKFPAWIFVCQEIAGYQHIALCSEWQGLGRTQTVDAIRAKNAVSVQTREVQYRNKEYGGTLT